MVISREENSSITDSIKKIPVKQDAKLLFPSIYTALGMALAYYTYPLLISFSAGIIILLFIIAFLAVIISFFRVLRSTFSTGQLKITAKAGHTIYRIAVIAVAASVGFTLGIASRRASPGSAETGIPADMVIAVSGKLIEDPRSLQSGTGLGIIELRECSGTGGLRATARGNLTVFFPEESIVRLKNFGRGCEIYTEGVFIPGVATTGGVNQTASSNTDSKPQSHSGPLFRAASVHITKPASSLDAFRTKLRMILLGKIVHDETENTPVWGSLAAALLLGVRDDLSGDLLDAFRSSGCAHILALSGMHLAIISGILAFFLKRPLGIRWASLVGALFIIFYVFVAGSQPSLVRSAIMYLIGTFMIWGLLKGKSISLLCMAFIIQLLFQGETGTSLSFILSYLALAGMLTLGETIRCILRGRLPQIISGSFSASFGAFVFTAPIVVFYFGSLYPIGILAGLLVIPLSSLFMIFALAALAAGFLPVPLWNIFDIILTGIYRTMELIVSAASVVPGIKYSNPLPVAAISIVLWIFAILIKRRDYLHRSSIAAFN